MPSLYTPQSQSGIMSFYDAQTGGPKMSPKIVLAAIVLFTVIVLIADHIAFA
jgi:preprotein translocase subunit Sec61beta